jgi:hypothetical protein
MLFFRSPVSDFGFGHGLAEGARRKPHSEKVGPVLGELDGVCIVRIDHSIRIIDLLVFIQQPLEHGLGRRR